MSTTTISPIASAVAETTRGTPVPASTKGRAASRLPRNGGFRALLANVGWREAAAPIAVLCIVLAMILPLPPFLLDLLISANIALSVIVLLVSMYITKPVELSVFPTTLLLMTLFRLALNISSSRLILLGGNAGTAAAGDVIEAFGNFVVGGNYVIGVVIFLVLIAIQYVVINHGAVRISEVTARFTLDALPGKQMSIDSDLNAGLIDEAEARSRRKQLAAEAEFYGAMDGATRFTQRDAIASILITGINIVAGFLIGVLQHGMDLRKAISTYTILTIGDGLVTVIPALMISICGGLIVTRAGSEHRVGADFQKQIFGASQPLLLASGVLAAMAAFPGFPKIPFLLLAAGAGFLGWRIKQSDEQTESAAAQAQPAAASNKDHLESLLKVDLLAVEVGLGLVKFVEGGQNSPLLRRIAGIRRQLASELGYILPPVRVTDNLSLKAREYVLTLKGAEVARYEIPQGADLAIAPTTGLESVDGEPTREPAFGIAAIWVRNEAVDRARQAGYTVVDGISVLGTHLSEVIRRYAHELFTRQEAKKLLDRVAEDNQKVVEDLVPKLLPLSTVQRVLQNLLRERVSIRDGASILESLSEAGQITKNPILLTEYVRQALRRMLVRPYISAGGDLAAYLVDGAVEKVIEAAIEHGEQISHLNLPPQRTRELLDKVAHIAGPADTSVVLICGAAVRSFVRQIVEGSFPNVAVLSHSEIPPGVRVVSLGTVR